MHLRGGEHGEHREADDARRDGARRHEPDADGDDDRCRDVDPRMPARHDRGTGEGHREPDAADEEGENERRDHQQRGALHELHHGHERFGSSPGAVIAKASRWKIASAAEPIAPTSNTPAPRRTPERAPSEACATMPSSAGT